MGNFNRDSRGGGRSFGRRDFGSRGFDRGGGRGDSQMFKTVCSDCGNECEVPFRPTSGKPVYCSDCFEKKGGRRSDSPRPQRSDFRRQSSDQNKTQFDALNIKLDRILKILEPKVDSKVISIPAVVEVKETKPSKVKKVVAKVVVEEKVKEVKTPKVKKVVAKKKN